MPGTRYVRFIKEKSAGNLNNAIKLIQKLPLPKEIRIHDKGPHLGELLDITIGYQEWLPEKEISLASLRKNKETYALFMTDTVNLNVAAREIELCIEEKKYQDIIDILKNQKHRLLGDHEQNFIRIYNAFPLPIPYSLVSLGLQDVRTVEITRRLAYKSLYDLNTAGQYLDIQDMIKVIIQPNKTNLASWDGLIPFMEQLPASYFVEIVQIICILYKNGTELLQELYWDLIAKKFSLLAIFFDTVNLHAGKIDSNSCSVLEDLYDSTRQNAFWLFLGINYLSQKAAWACLTTNSLRAVIKSLQSTVLPKDIRYRWEETWANLQNYVRSKEQFVFVRDRCLLLANLSIVQSDIPTTLLIMKEIRAREIPSDDQVIDFLPVEKELLKNNIDAELIARELLKIMPTNQGQDLCKWAFLASNFIGLYKHSQSLLKIYKIILSVLNSQNCRVFINSLDAHILFRYYFFILDYYTAIQINKGERNYIENTILHAAIDLALMNNKAIFIKELHRICLRRNSLYEKYMQILRTGTLKLSVFDKKYEDFLTQLITYGLSSEVFIIRNAIIERTRTNPTQFHAKILIDLLNDIDNRKYRLSTTSTFISHWLQYVNTNSYYEALAFLLKNQINKNFADDLRDVCIRIEISLQPMYFQIPKQILRTLDYQLLKFAQALLRRLPINTDLSA